MSGGDATGSSGQDRLPDGGPTKKKLAVDFARWVAERRYEQEAARALAVTGRVGTVVAVSGALLALGAAAVPMISKDTFQGLPAARQAWVVVLVSLAFAALAAAVALALYVLLGAKGKGFRKQDNLAEWVLCQVGDQPEVQLVVTGTKHLNEVTDGLEQLNGQRFRRLGWAIWLVIGAIGAMVVCALVVVDWLFLP